MYIFPRQFGLHNVFTSTVDRQQTAQRFQDYTLREEEIAKKFPKKDAQGRPCKIHVPKRLRGTPERLVQKMQILHSRCAYAKMLQHYCPVRPRAPFRRLIFILFLGFRFLIFNYILNLYGY